VAVAAAIHMPRVDSITDFTPKLITTLHDRQGDTFATFARERRVLLDESEVPEVLEQALLAVEDSKFYQHGGIDLAAVVRAEVANLRAGERVEGASTLTMQLARTLFLTREKTWRRKIEETLLAVELEKSLSKQQILTLYMNLMNLGHGNYGFASAARYYFGKEVGQLEVHEAAMLAGIVQMPSRLSPYRRPDLVRERRDWVLRRMLDEGFISRDQHAAAVAEPLGVVTHAPDSPFAPYFVEDVRRYLEPTYGTAAVHEGGMEVWTTLDPAIQRAAETALDEGLLRIDHRRWRGAVRNLVEQGEDPETVELDVWASQPLLPGHWVQGVVLDAGRERARVRVQEEEFEIGPEAIEWTRRGSPSDVLSRGDVAWFEVLAPAGAEAAADEAAPDEPGEPGEGAGALDLPPAMPDLDPTALRLALQQVPEVQGAVVVLEAATGAIRAMVGGWDFERSKFNRVTQAQRQVGSAFKPFVYGTALEMGYTPADTLFDGPTGFPGATGELTYWPRNHGRNYHGIVTLRYALERSINIPAVKLLDLVGIDRVVDFARRAGIRSELPPYPSLALGSADISPLEMAAAYAAILNQGTWVEPYMIERVTSAGGQLLEQHTPVTGTVTDPRVAYVLTHMMEGVVDRGTAGSVRGLPIDLAGKTGTTDDYTDAWFVGFTPRFVVLAWVGHDVKRSLGSGMTGSVVALPIWRDVVEAGLEDGWLREGETFTPPPGVVFETVEYRTGLLPGAAASAGEAGGTIQEAFLRGTEPVQSSTPRTALVHSLPWYQQRPFYIPKEGENMTSRRAAAEAEDGEVPEGGGESPADVAETAGAE
jgi:penicillin-binding protein 1A